MALFRLVRDDYMGRKVEIVRPPIDEGEKEQPADEGDVDGFAEARPRSLVVDLIQEMNKIAMVETAVT